MERIVIFIQKYSDWLEAYSVIKENPELPIICHFVENERNDESSMKSIFEYLTNAKVIYLKYENFLEMEAAFSTVKDGDIFVAPLCRFRSLWRTVKKSSKRIRMVCLSESLPESFGLIGYRLGFQGRKLKTKLALPALVLYDFLNKPEIGYFPYSKIKNPFVKSSFPASIPPLSPYKQKLIEELTGGKKRPLIVSGWGYNLENMVDQLGLTEYIATSKGLELVVDGQKIPINERICSEEVLLSGYVSYVVGYNSATMVWAKYIYPNISIDCYESLVLNKLCGKFGTYSKKTFEKIGIEVKMGKPEMMD